MDSIKAVIYCRVSDSKQVEGYSLTVQENICRDYALRKGYEIIKVFIEEGESAKTDDRTQLQNLLEYCKARANGIRTVIFYKIDRWARQHYDYLDLKLLLRRSGINLESATENITDTPVGRYMENMLASQAQFDNEIRAERSTNGMKEAVSQGRYVWKAPFGYINAKVDGKSTIMPGDNAPVVVQAFEEVGKNQSSVEAVYREMVQKGFVQLNEKPYSRNQFHLLLRNKLYTGEIHKFGKVFKGTFKPLISVDLFDHVQRVLRSKGRKIRWKVDSNNPDFPLRKIIMDPSGAKLTGSWATGRRKKRYAYYFFRKTRGGVFAKALLESKFVNFLNRCSFDDTQIDRLKSYLIAEFSTKKQRDEVKMEKLKEQISSLKRKQKILISKALDGIIADSIFQRELAALEEEIMHREADQLVLQSSIASHTIVDLKETVIEYLKKPGNIWADGSFAVKSAIQGFQLPKGATFDGKRFKTPEVCKLFKARNEVFGSLSYRAPQTFQNWKHLEIDNHAGAPEDLDLTRAFRNAIVKDLKELTSILEKNDEKSITQGDNQQSITLYK